MLILISASCKKRAYSKEQIEEAHGKMAMEMKNDPKRHERQCNEGKLHSCTREGIFYAFGTWGHKKDYVKARLYFEKACNGGNVEGCKELGTLYRYGRGIERNYAKSLDLYTKACTGKERFGCYYAAEQYQYGHGPAKNIEKAKEYFAKACEAGFKSACDKKL
jgi:uncharacterized protein